MSRKKKAMDCFSEATKGIGHGNLKDSFGAWKMSDEEEERIFSRLNQNWKKTTLAIRAAEEKPPEDDQDVDKLVKSLLKLKRTGKEPLILRLNKPATAVVTSGRDRWHM